jgi:hypothetical protein
MQIKRWVCRTLIVPLFCTCMGMSASLSGELQNQAKDRLPRVPRFTYDPNWPKPLPDQWVLGSVGSVCVDSRDHVFAVTRGVPERKEQNLAIVAPPVIEFDADGNLVNAWGDRNSMARTQHGCFIDKDNNFWTAGNNDGIVQKYTHDGSRMLLQIGTRGSMDSSDGSASGTALNASHISLFKPTQVAVDADNGDIYVSDGYGNRRVVVFDRRGQFLRQWGRQASQTEINEGAGGVFLGAVHCLAISNDEFVYVCDRLADRVEVFDKMGNFKGSIHITSTTAHRRDSEDAVGAAGWVAFSPDPSQEFMYVADGADDVIYILDRKSGQILSKFGRPGNQSGDFIDPHCIAVNSKGDIIVGEVPYGGKIQMWRLKGN